MLNHARTVLLNYRGPHAEQLETPGDVYIPVYDPMILTPELAAVYTLLFGTAFDYRGLVYRSSQYLGLMHSTEYEPYVYAQDSRITYSPDELTVMEDSIFATV